MKVTATLEGDQIFTLDVNDDLELENFKALLQFECHVQSSQIVIFHNGVPLRDDKKTLNGYGIKDGDVLWIQRALQSTQRLAQPSGAAPVAPVGGLSWGSIQVPNSSSRPQSARNQAATAQPIQSRVDTDSPEYIRDMFLADPHQLSLLKERNPELADALLSGNLQGFTSVLQRQRQERADRDMQRIRTMNADPFDLDAQKQIAEEIRLSNVNQNMEIAMEYSPESFGKVVMLYIDCKLDGHPVKAFVDSGAQMTFMSVACAERCHIMRLLDQRWAGIAKGVGTQKIVGRVHVAQIQIEKDFLPSSFSVMEDQPMDLVLGLDMLKRHQCCIDLKNNVLRIGTTGTETPFLSESDLPMTDRLAFSDEGEVEDKELAEMEDKELAEAMDQSVKETAQGASSSSQSSSGTGVASASSGAGVASFPEASIQKIIDLGFTRDQAILELQRANGNVDLAATALLARSIKLPSSTKR
ncbi:cyanamide hydratase [Desmophyllum pertusum]|uniref:Cyanamide hydratase n=1 Tax=Desmophyllum pertusum TaxID=174260 RepID=A0A9X0A656_9CNID|nr:cyanamide hydratase [Desmophyllum pertusum]